MIVGAIQTINDVAFDVLIVAGGGGPIEDLWACNNERVASAIFESRVPVISAVGHETDFSIADLVADVRAPTPSAAELVTPDARELGGLVRAGEQRLAQTTRGRLGDARIQLSQGRRALEGSSPEVRVANDRQRVDDLTRRFVARVLQVIALKRGDLNGAVRHLAALSA